MSRQYVLEDFYSYPLLQLFYFYFEFSKRHTNIVTQDESLLIPKMITGENVPTTSDHKSKKSRKVNYYLNSLSLATFILIFTILDSLFIQDEWFYFTFFSQLNDPFKIIATFTLEFIIGLIVFYIVNYVWGELSVRRYNRKIDELEDPYE